MKRIRRSIYIISILSVIVACNVALPVPTGTATNASLATLLPTTTTIVSTPSSGISPISPTQLATVTPTPYPEVIDKTNVERLALLRQWDVENLAYSYDSANFWFADSNQFLVPMIGSPSMVGLQSFAVDSSTPLWFIPSLQVDFTINEHDEVMLNLEGIKAFNKQGEEIQTIRANERCDVYSPLSNYTLAIPDADLVITGVQDSYRDFGLNGDNTDKARVLIWDISNNTCSDLIEQFDGIITSLSASYDGHYISYVVVVQTTDPSGRTTRIFDLKLRKEKCELVGGLDAHFTRQGQLVVYDVTDDSISVVMPEDCTVEKKFNVGTEIMSAFSLSPNGELLAGVTDFAVLFWNLQTGEKLREIGIGEPNLRIIGFSPDGRFLVTAKRADDLLKKDKLMLWGISEE